MIDELALGSQVQVWTLRELVGTAGILKDGDWVETHNQDPRGDVRLVQLADVGRGVFRNRSNRWLTTETARRLNCTFLRAGDVLIARLGDPAGAACVFPGVGAPAVTAVDVCILRPALSTVDVKWLAWMINAPTFRRDVIRYQSGTTRKRISRKNLERLHVPVPPWETQVLVREALEENLSRLDHGARILEDSCVRLKQLKETVLESAIRGHLVPQSDDADSAGTLLKRILEERRCARREQENRKAAAKGKRPTGGAAKKGYEEPLEPTRPPIAELPEGWVWTSLDAIAEVELGKMLNREAREGEQQRPYLANLNVRWGSFDLADLRTMAIPEEKRERYRVRPGDLLVCEGGEVGRCAVWNGELGEVYYQKALHRVRPHPDVSVYYLAYLLRGYAAMGAYEQLITGSTIKHLPREDLRRLPIPLPPLEEQYRIVAEVDRRFSFIDAAERQVDGGLARAETLRESLLHAAITGRLARSQAPGPTPTPPAGHADAGRQQVTSVGGI